MLSRVIKEVLTEEVTFMSGTEEGEEIGCGDIWEKTYQGEGGGKHRGPVWNVSNSLGHLGGWCC